MEEIIEHLVGRINEAQMRAEPAPHIFVEGIFPAEFYKSILEEFSAVTPALEKQVHTGDPKIFFGSYGDRVEAHVPRDLGRMAPATAQFWSGLFTAFKSPAFLGAVKLKFEAGFRARFGDEAASPGFVERFRPNMLLTKHRSNYYLGPHTDIFSKVVTCVFNCAERDCLEHLGTALYAPKKAGFTCNGSVHHNPDLFVETGRLPFKMNSALIFFRDDRFFHGVARLSDQDLMGSERPNIQFNLWNS